MILPFNNPASQVVTYFAAPYLVDWYIDIYTSVYGVDTTYTDIILKFNNYLKMLINSNSATTSVFTNMILGIGVVLLLMHFFSDLSEKAAANQLSTLQMGKSFCTAIAAVFVIFNAKYIFIFMMSMVESLNETLQNTINGIWPVSGILQNGVIQLLLGRCVGKYFSIGAVIGYTLAALLILIATYVTKVYITYYAITRIIQLFVYYVFLPIGISDIFENGIGGTINFRSRGFKYLKTIFALMLQLVVVTIICQSFSLITTRINIGYFVDQGDTTYDTNFGDVDIEENYAAATRKNAESVLYPLLKFEYTDHKATVTDIIYKGVNDVKKAVETIGGAITDGDIDLDTSNSAEKLSDSEKYKVLCGKSNNEDGIIRYGGDKTSIAPGKEEEVEKIMKDSKYRMTIDSTERFFKWCIGTSGEKIVLFIILLAVKVLMVQSSTNLCNDIMGTSV